MATAAPSEPLKLDKPLIVYWTFDEAMGGVCRDASGNGCDATAAAAAAPSCARRCLTSRSTTTSTR